MNNLTYEDLAAQVEVLRGALEPFAVTGLPSCVEREDYSVMQERVKDWFGVTQFKKAIEAYNQTPIACLAQVRAEAGRAGFIEGSNQTHLFLTGDISELPLLNARADQYAERIRQEGK